MTNQNKKKFIEFKQLVSVRACVRACGKREKEGEGGKAEDEKFKRTLFFLTLRNVSKGRWKEKVL